MQEGFEKEALHGSVDKQKIQENTGKDAQDHKSCEPHKESNKYGNRSIPNWHEEGIHAGTSGSNRRAISLSDLRQVIEENRSKFPQNNSGSSGNKNPSNIRNDRSIGQNNPSNGNSVCNNNNVGQKKNVTIQNPPTTGGRSRPTPSGIAQLSSGSNRAPTRVSGSNNTTNSARVPGRVGSSYSRVVRADRIIHIAKKHGYPLSMQDYNSLRHMVIREQERATDFYPTFDRVGFANGDVIFNCADEATCIWLGNAINLIGASWGQGDLGFHTEADLSNMRRVSISFPWDNLYPFEATKVLKNLSLANRGLDTSQWLIKRLIDPETAQGRKIVSLMIDAASASFIESHGRRLYYQLGNVRVRFHGPGDRGIETDH
jgi:hypothetical protein